MGSLSEQVPFCFKTKESINQLKSVLKDITHETQVKEKESAVSRLVSSYLNCPVKFSAKRIISSYFQNLDIDWQQYAEKEICLQFEQAIQSCDFQSESRRQHVDTVASLMENFKLGQHCLSTIALPVVRFLIQSKKLFLQQVHADVPPVRLNEVMHHCHVTVQTLNLLLQKVVLDSSHLVQSFVTEATMLQELWDVDVAILSNELFLLDCRCCCAMNIFLVLQLILSKEDLAIKVPHMLLPSAVHKSSIISQLPVWVTEARQDALNLHSLSLLSCLSLTFGYTAMVTPYATTQILTDGSIFYTDVFLPHLLKVSFRCTDTTSKALLGKTMSLYATKLLEVLQKVEPSQQMLGCVKGESEMVQSLLGYVWTNWEDQLDIVRQSAKVVFEKILQIHCLINKAMRDINLENSPQLSGVKKDKFLRSLVRHLFTVSWSSRGKFSALTSCVKQTGCQALLDARPGLSHEVIQQLQEQAVSCYASELYCALFTSCKEDLNAADQSSSPTTQTLSKGVQDSKKSSQTKKADVTASQVQSYDENFVNMWIIPITDALCTGDKKLRQNIIEYLLPRLMKTGDAFLHSMVHQLTGHMKEKPQQAQGAIISCLHKARVLGLLRSCSPAGHPDIGWSGFITTDMLEAALCCLDEQVRLDAFALVCENHKTTETVTLQEFSLLRLFIPHNVNNQTPAFRQRFLALLKKLFFRMKESLCALKRKRKSKNGDRTSASAISNSESFLHWLTNTSMSNLYPGSAFARRTTSLAIVCLLCDFFCTDSDGFSVPTALTRNHIEALFLCLSDTFEENKKGGLSVLTSYLKHSAQIWDELSMKEILSCGFTLACSTRPQDCDTAVYILLAVLKQHEIYNNNFTAILSSAVEKANMYEVSSPVCQLPSVDPLAPASLQLLSCLLALLDNQIDVADQSLVSAAASRPMYPTLHCIRYVIQEMDFKSLSDDNISKCRDFISNLINSCLRLSSVVSPVVRNSSPEGNVPEEAMSNAEESSVDKSANAEWSRALVESMPEYLVVCSWRSIKEVSLTLGALCVKLLTSLIGGSGGLLSLDQVQVLGDYFTHQLLESIHRGAFELAYAGFQLLCQMLWSHPEKCFHQMPSSWLASVLADIRSGDPDSRLCATRRSAGVPFFVQAITSTEPSLAGRQSFHNAITSLLDIALGKTQENKGPSDAQVHSLNILRALYRESRLGEDVVSYVADGLKAAILGFKSEKWAVRNSATLLLSALMTRIFGVKRSKDESAMSKKNCQTGRSFFYRYPSLYPFLMSELQEATANIECKERLSLHPSLYPVLLVLGRLFPSTLEGADTSLSLSAFIPYVVRCASSPVYKTRVIASRAIQPLAKRNEVITISQTLWDCIPQKPSHNSVHSSQIHGCLLQLKHLVQLVESFSEINQAEVISAFLQNINSRVWLLDSANRCYATRQAALVFTDVLLNACDALISDKKTTLPETNLKQALVSALSQEVSNPGSSYLPFYFEYETTRGQLCLKHLISFVRIRNVKTSDAADKNFQVGVTQQNGECSPDSVVLSLLTAPIYDVREGVLDILLSAVQTSRATSVGGCASSSGVAASELLVDDAGDCGIASQVQHFSSGALNVINDALTRLGPHLLTMAMETEKHHLCLEKVYYLLSFLPNICNLLNEKDDGTLTQIMMTLLSRVNKERRTEVKAAILRFMSRLVPTLYQRASQVKKQNSSAENGQEWGCQIIQSIVCWLDVLRQQSTGGDNPDVQLSCCHALLQNAVQILLDPASILGFHVFTSWTCLATLLQDDDMMVKDVVTNVLCVITDKPYGSYQASYALHILPSILVKLHGNRDRYGTLHCLAGWMFDDIQVGLEETQERLFDKGELNTYLDSVAFTRSIVESLTETNNSSKASGLFDNTGSMECRTLTENLSSPEIGLTSYLENCAMNLQKELDVLRSSCKAGDMYLSNSRYLSLSEAVFKARVLVRLFKVYLPCGESKLNGSLDYLNAAVNSLDELSMNMMVFSIDC